MSTNVEELKKVACDAIDNKLQELDEVSSKLWENPELALEEHYAHSLLTEFLENQGFTVERKHVLETGFRAVYGSNKEGPQIAVICEYDALPGIGHACGHNLIAEVGVGAAVGIKAVLDSAGAALGRIVVFGTPAEENHGGKLMIIKSGSFADISLAMMSHPFPLNLPKPIKFALAKVDVHYHGKASHAAGFPWEGINALDAAIMAYNNVSALRQQMKPSWRVHGIITNGGSKPNIIPEEASMQYYIRTPRMSELEIIKTKMTGCFEAAARATGCTVDLVWNERIYENMITSEPLADLYTANAQHVGVVMEPDEEKRASPTGSTDMGNVSHVVPSIHPMFYIGTMAANHTRQFTVATGAPEAQSYTIQQAKALAMTAVDVYCKPQLLKDIQQDFKLALQKDTAI